MGSGDVVAVRKRASAARRRALTAANGGVAPVEVHDESTYTNWACGCGECRADHARAKNEARARRRALTVANGGVAPVDKHNASTHSNWGCTCGECRGDSRRLKAESRARLRGG